MSEALKNNGSTQSTISRQYKVRGRPNRLIIKESLIELFQIFVDMTLGGDLNRGGKNLSAILSHRRLSNSDENDSTHSKHPEHYSEIRT